MRFLGVIYLLLMGQSGTLCVVGSWKLTSRAHAWNCTLRYLYLPAGYKGRGIRSNFPESQYEERAKYCTILSLKHFIG
jgi:hypothetical protein